NWSSLTTDGATHTRATNYQNEVTFVSGAGNPSYDLNGNMTTDEAGNTLVYDAWNRLVKETMGTNNVAFTYDALGRQVSMNPSWLSLVYYYYNPSWQVIEEQAGGTTQAQFVWNPLGVNSLVERDTGTTRIYAEHDANGDVTSLVDATGNAIER